MKKNSIEEFKNQSNIEILKSLIKLNNGYITSKDVTALGIHRMNLNIMCEKGIIEKVGKGIYIYSKKYEDSYFVFSLENPKVIFSHMTALYFYELSIKAPSSEYDITIFNKYHNPKIKKHNIFYVSKEIYNLGLTEVETPIGNKVKAYLFFILFNKFSFLYLTFFFKHKIFFFFF